MINFDDNFIFMILRRFITVLFITHAISCLAYENQETIAIDADTLSSTAEKRGLIDRIMDYLEESNKVRYDKAFDFSIIGGPHYSSDTKFGIGIVAAGLYRHDLNDTIRPPSSVSIYADATTGGFFNIGICGTNIFPDDNFRLSYDCSFQSFSTKFWGIGYGMNIDDGNESDYKYLKSEILVDFVVRLAKNVYLGPMISFDYINGRDFEKPWLWDGQSGRTINLGVGFTFKYDTRDFLSNPYKGVYVSLDQRFNPGFLANRYSFSMTEITAASYNKVWKGGVIASQLHSRLTYGNTPWGLLSTLGGSNSMRGYYDGRYRDKNAVDITVELRQHIWRRNGMAAWIGAGSIFPRFSDFRWRHVLPNYGIGYRWEFKKRVNVRLDLGFGKHQTGFIFSLNEAF